MAGSGSAGSNLPRSVKEETARVTPKSRIQPTYELIEAAAEAFSQGRYRPARKKLLEAKKLSSRAPIIRELLGLSAYRLGDWEEALRELRTYRRLTGDTTHMPIEMDCLRALKRNDAVEETWRELKKHGGHPAAVKEGRVVYGAFLLDQGNPRQAWEVTKPKRMGADAHEADLRQWYVAARAAAALGDVETARQLQRGIREHNDAFPGMEGLEEEISNASSK